MSQKAKFRLASALILVAIATAPALLCITYLARNTSTHSCCPQEKSQKVVIASCCVYSPAITTPNVDAPASMIAAATFLAVDQTALVSDVDPVVFPNLDTSPPGCTSVLRI
jgi:hypothetical protein